MKRGVAFSGGGAKGWFQQEIISVLRQEGITFDQAAGVSVGALNGYMAADGRIGDLAYIWREISNKQVYKGKLNAWHILKALASGRNYILDHSPLKGLLNEVVTRMPTRSSLTMGIVNMETGDYHAPHIDNRAPHIWSLENLRQLMLASAAIPLAFEPVKLTMPASNVDRDPNLVDGGVRNNSPLRDLMRQGCDEIWVINCNRRGLDEWHGGNLIKTAGRTFEIIMNEGLRNDIEFTSKLNRLAQANGGEITDSRGNTIREVPLHVLEPQDDIGDMLDFDTRKHRGEGTRVVEQHLEEFKIGI